LAVRLRWVTDAFVAGDVVSFVSLLSLAGAGTCGGAASFGSGAVSFADSPTAAPSVGDGFVLGGSVASVAGAV
jgi:hypothetical protein